jgi:beta-glucosidase
LSQEATRVSYAEGAPRLSLKTIIQQEGIERGSYALAREADVVILALGEGRHMSGEAASRTSLDPARVPNSNLLEAIQGYRHIPVVLVLMAGRPLDIRLGE